MGKHGTSIEHILGAFLAHPDDKNNFSWSPMVLGSGSRLLTLKSG